MKNKILYDHLNGSPGQAVDTYSSYSFFPNSRHPLA